MFRRWILPILLILAAGSAAAWVLAHRGADPLEPPRRGGSGNPAPPPPKPPDRGPPFAVLFGGELAGRLWIPTCSKFRQGGLSRVGPAIQETAKGAQIAMVLDAGDLAGAPGEAGAAELEASLTALFDSDVAVSAVGERDLMVGLERWRRVKGIISPDMKLICANLRDDQDRELAPSVAHFEPGRKKVLVSAVLSPSFEKGLREAGVPVKILPPGPAVRAALAAAGRADYVIVISHAPIEESRALLRAVPEADLVITAHAGPLPSREPEIIDGRMLLAPGEGWLFVSGAILRDAGEGRKPEFVDNFLRAVAYGIPPSPPVQFQADRVATAMRSPGFLEGVLRESAAAVPPGTPAYAGPAACAACHPAAHGTWGAEPHARSMAGVRAKKFETVWLCLPCHTTGPGRPGGHLAPGDGQAAVTCEACHGPGGAHVAAEGRSRMEDAKASCARCHTPDMSPGFKFADAWEKVKHGK